MISDEENVAEFSALAGPAMAAVGRGIIVHGIGVTVKETGKVTRAEVIEWDNLDAAEKGYNSEGYQEALAALDGGAVREFRYIEAI